MTITGAAIALPDIHCKRAIPSSSGKRMSLSTKANSSSERAVRAAATVEAVATSKPLRFTVMMLDEMGLSKYFDFVGGAESDSSRDSKIEVIRYVMQNLGMTSPEGTLMVGDRLYDIDGARQAGMQSAGALWGYGTAEELKAHGADYLFATPQELGDFVLC